MTNVNTFLSICLILGKQNERELNSKIGVNELSILSYRQLLNDGFFKGQKKQILQILLENPPLTRNEIARMMNTVSSSISYSIRQLILKDIIHEVGHKKDSDSRMKNNLITVKGLSNVQ